MAWILGMIIVTISLESYASNNCKIDYVNEVSANRSIHNLFRQISSNKKILASKGYQLVSAIGPIPTFSGFVQVDEIETSRLSMTVYKNDSPRIWQTSVKFKNTVVGVRSLFRKLPACHLFPM